MKSLKKLLAIFLVITIVCGIMPGIAGTAFAQTTKVSLNVASYESGTLKLSWSLSGTRSAKLTYHVPADPVNDDQTAVKEEFFVDVITDNTGASVAVPGLVNDYIYDIKVEMYDDTVANGGGIKIGEGFTYYLPRVTFYAKRVYETGPVNGEIGTTPRLNIKWSMPRVCNGGSFVYADTVLDYMETQINNVYNNNTNIDGLDYKINFSTELSKLNSGASQISINTTTNMASTSSESITTSAKVDTRVNGWMEVDVIGRKDKTITLKQEDAADYILPNNDIFPGTVYYMNIKPDFKDGGSSVNPVTVGTPSSYNGSSVIDAESNLSYVYTPVRFKLWNDDVNNLYAKVYRINQGSLDMPGLYYEIQATDVPIAGDWPVKAKMTDSFFPANSDYAITVMPDVNPNAEVYYKIVVKTDSSKDRIESQKYLYKISFVSSKPPVPIGITIEDRTLREAEVLDPIEGNILTKITDVKIAWKKPANWDSMNKSDTYFHIALNTNQIDITTQPYPMLESDGKKYGEFQPRYRLVKYFSAECVQDMGSYLQYTLKGDELFKWEYRDMDGNPVSNEFPDEQKPETGYPQFLLPNMVYYMQIYTTTDAKKGSVYETDSNEMSEKSVIVSFTTLAGIERDVPLPKNLRINRNEVEIVKDSANKSVLSNFVELQFEKVNVDWTNYGAKDGEGNHIYYDLYMSTSTETESFVLVGTTQFTGNDVAFTGTDNQSTFIKAVVRNFSQGTGAYTEFGSKLKPNTTYYFVVKTRLVIQGQNPDKQSISTVILPVTTKKGDIQPPDETAKKPLAPSDFTIAQDDKGNLILSGNKAAFTWKREQTGVTYNIICTTNRVAVDAVPSEYENDPLYKNFLQNFGTISLDPSTAVPAPGFAYSSTTKQCTYTIDKWLFPNRLYYFSIRAELWEGGTLKSASAWVSIPVTTLLIDSPDSLQPVNDSQLGFYWTDFAENAKAEDYKVYLKGPKDSDYIMLTRNKYTVVKDNYIYYARINNLESDSLYSIRVYKGTTNLEQVYEQIGTRTRDNYHHVEIKWKGLPVDNYSKYEIAIRAEGETDYTILTDSDLEEYIDANGHIFPFYVEKTSQTTGTSYSYYYAKIKTIPVKNQGGAIVHQPLKSNMKYYIKVRAVKTDPGDAAIKTYSKYIGPVFTRTEFNQDDYDRNEQDNEKKVAFLDRVKELEESIYWRLHINSKSYDKILVKGDRLINAIENNGVYPYVLDLSKLSASVDTDVIYMPVSVMEFMGSKDKSLVIKTSGAEFTLRPNMMDMDSIVSLKNKAGVNDLFVRVTITRTDSPVKKLPDGLESVSKVNDLKVKGVGSSKTYTQLKEMFDDRLYNTSTGIINQKLNVLMSTGNISSGSDFSKELEEYIGHLLIEIESELSDYIGDTVEGTVWTSGIILSTVDVNEFSNPLGIKLIFNNSNSLKTPYIYYNGANSWQKIINNINSTANSLRFNAVKPGTFLVAASLQSANDVPANHWVKHDLDLLTSKFDLGDVFGKGKSFYPENSVTTKEIILLYETVIGRSGENTGLDVKQRAKKLGIDDIINISNVMKTVTRQEVAGTVLRVYCIKTSADLSSLRPQKSIFIKDEQGIWDNYYKSVIMAVDMGIMGLNNEGKFIPVQNMTRAEVVSAFVKLLKLTGDLN